MATFPYDHVITENLQTSAELVINTRPDVERVEWVAFLLNEMQGLLPDDEMTSLLELVQTRIAGRLESGVW
ncbi:MAG: hypothetical protein KDI07_20715 [Anaerolineae bacterium]|nr:hypothetical protein [Anaerolineae bacterium]MCB9130665.1 hypothetical protein [Anaerolineales bacterium]MCB0234659.1 hypothetical protein [Anaerolineae bacterium]MCB0251007.1 hypothetical protein [Anaerolineae bacterium]MCB9142339.1 hypothetical protein [Anaerolineales bacterium]